MSAPRIALASVRRKSGGRIHLTPRVPSSGPVTTLCGQVLGDGTFAAVDTPADCTNCQRRSKDQARISGAFFEQEEGSELLRLSLEQAQARGRKPNLTVVPGNPGAKQGPDKPVVWPAPTPPPAVVPDRVGELATAGFKRSSEGVWRSPGGVIVRLKREGKDWRFSELVYEGEVLVTRGDRGMKIRAGDVEVAPAGDGYEVSIRRK